MKRGDLAGVRGGAAPPGPAAGWSPARRRLAFLAAAMIGVTGVLLVPPDSFESIGKRSITIAAVASLLFGHDGAEARHDQ